MTRETLIAQAKQASMYAKHNLKMIRKYPEKVNDGKAEKAEAYLNMMIRFAEEEKQNAQRPGWTSKKMRKKLINIVPFAARKCKGVE